MLLKNKTVQRLRAVGLRQSEVYASVLEKFPKKQVIANDSPIANPTKPENDPSDDDDNNQSKHLDGKSELGKMAIDQTKMQEGKGSDNI